MARSILKIVSLCSIEVGKEREKALQKNIPARNSISIIAFTLIHTLHIFHVSLSKLGLRASFHLMYFTQFQKQGRALSSHGMVDDQLCWLAGGYC